MRNIIFCSLILFSTLFAKRVNFEQQMNVLADKITRNVSPVNGLLKTVVIIPLNDSRAPGFA